MKPIHENNKYVPPKSVGIEARVARENKGEFCEEYLGKTAKQFKK